MDGWMGGKWAGICRMSPQNPEQLNYPAASLPANVLCSAIDWSDFEQASDAFVGMLPKPAQRGRVSAFNCNCLAEWCCFNILYRFLCNTLTCRQPRARINSAQESPFVKSQSCFNDAWRNIQALTFSCQVPLEKSIKMILLWPSYPVNAY